MLSQFEKGRRTVAVEDAVLWVGPQGSAVQMDGSLKVPALTCLVALLYFLHELCFAEATSDRFFADHAADRSSRRPRTKDRELQKWNGDV